MNASLNRFLKNTSWIMFGRVFQLGLTFITTMIVTRHLGPEKFGRLTYVYSYVQLFIPLCTLGLNDIVVKELINNKEKRNEIVGTISLIRSLSALVSMICSVSIVYFVKNSSIYYTIAILESFSLLFQSFDCIMYFYQSKLLSQKTGIIYAVSYVITALYRILGIIYKFDILWFAFAYSLDYIVVAIMLISVYLKDDYKFKFSFSIAKDLLKKSSPYIFSGIMVVIYGKVVDTLFLGEIVSDTAVGYYGAATTLCNAWPFILTAIIDSAAPIIIDLFEKDNILFKKRLKQLYATIFYIGFTVATLITILAKYIILIAYGEGYMESITPLRIVCWSSIFAYIGVARSIWMQCEKKTKYETVISLFGATINILLNYFMIRYYGIIGASITILLTQILTNFVILFIIKDTRENAKLILDAIMLKDVFK